MKLVKKKKFEKGTIVRAANTLLGLNTHDIANVDVKAKWELSNSLVDVIHERASVKIIELVSTQTKTDSFYLDIS